MKSHQEQAILSIRLFCFAYCGRYVIISSLIFEIFVQYSVWPIGQIQDK